MRGSIRLGAAAATALSALGTAAAQSAPPFGYWEEESGGQYLNWSTTDGACSFAANGTVTAGICDWQPTSTGGVLTLTYQWTIAPGHLYFNVLWQDQDTITIEGFVFHKKG